MKTTIAICSAGLLLAAVLIVWQARALSRRELVCRFCGKQLRLPWNRLLLRQVMKEAGFHPLPSEWWHFNRVSRQTAKERYRVIP